VPVQEERRFCDRCMTRTAHEITEEPDAIYTYKRRRLYTCKECGKKSMKRGLRPSAESVY
jgi:ribosomal protein L44E